MHKMLIVFSQVAATVISSAHHWIHCFSWIMHSLDTVLHKPSTELCTEHQQLRGVPARRHSAYRDSPAGTTGPLTYRSSTEAALGECAPGADGIGDVDVVDIGQP